MTQCKAVYQTRRGVAKRCLHPAQYGGYCGVHWLKREAYSESPQDVLRQIVTLLHRAEPKAKCEEVKHALGLARRALLQLTTEGP